MHTQEQFKAYDKGLDLYFEALDEKKAADGKYTSKYLDLLLEALDTLGPYVDEVDDIYYKIIFATVVQALQDSSEINFSDDYCQNTKIEIYCKVFKWFMQTTSYKTLYKPILAHLFIAFAEILLKGEEIARDDEVAYYCIKHSEELSPPLEGRSMLSWFEKDNDGQIRYIGSHN